MRTPTPLLLAVACFPFGPVLPAAFGQSAKPASPAPAGKGIVGIWEGRLAGAMTLTFTVRESGVGGPLSGTLSVLEQGGKPLLLKETTFAATDGAVTFAEPDLGLKVAGKLSADGSKIEATFTQRGQSLPLTLERKAAATVLRRPQEPEPPFPYREVPVEFENPKAPGVRLAGTLTIPAGKGPFPAALLLSGSGAQDRDETILGHKPFKLIADHLTRRGVAVLRVDDRGAGGSTLGPDPEKLTTADFAVDARAAVGFLKGRPEIDGGRIGLIGHSEGGIIAPMVAAEPSSGIAFVVLLAGTGVPGDRALLEQNTAMARAAGVAADRIETGRNINRRVYEVVRAEADPAKRRERLLVVIGEESKKLPPAERDALSAALRDEVRALGLPWFRFFLTHDPAPVLRKVTCPVLALNGGKDLQVLASQNLPAVEAALKAGGNKDVTVKELPGLNHLFQTAKTGLPDEYGSIEETFAPAALKLLGDWVVEKTKTAAAVPTAPAQK